MSEEEWGRAQGSEVVLLNVHSAEEVTGNLKQLGRCRNIALRHLQGNPLHREDLKRVRLASPQDQCRPPMRAFTASIG